MMWYDGAAPLDAEGWESAELNAMVRELQPNIIINNRSHLPEDFGTPEQHITAEPEGRMWEACMTMNDSWGYTPIDQNWKSAWNVVQMLRQVAAGSGNLLLNIGPMPDGTVPYECVGAFHQVGQWLRKYGPTIYDATDPMVQGWQTPGAFTRLGNTLYFHCCNWPGIELTIGGLRNQVREARFFAGDEINFTQDELRLVLHGLPQVAPDPLATVIELKVEGEPRQVLGFDLV